MHKTWQNEWRLILGQPVDAEIDIDVDFVLHFDIWHLERDQFFELFKNFPKGKQLAEKAYRLKWGNAEEFSKILSEEELIAETKKSIEILQQISPSPELDAPEITFQRGDTKLRDELLSNSDSLSIEADDQLPALIKKRTGKRGITLISF